VIISAEPKELTIVSIDGTLDLKQLAGLGGQFGIPKIDASASGAPASLTSKTPSGAKDSAEQPPAGRSRDHGRPFRRRRIASPARPRPSSESDAGSGTSAAESGSTVNDQV
jgi:hypothetical protein